MATEQTNINTQNTTQNQPTSSQTEKWYKSRQIQAAIITGLVSLIINLLNVAVQRLR